jgi:hypothetical protein
LTCHVGLLLGGLDVERLTGLLLLLARSLLLPRVARETWDREVDQRRAHRPGGGHYVGRVAMTKTRTHFTFRVDSWTPDGESIVEHIAGVEDFQVALATFRAASERWPGMPITLRQGAR